MNYIIITVPHAACIKDLHKISDTRAAQAAKLLENYLKSLGRNVILIANHETIRSDYDMNKREVRNKHYLLYTEKIISDILDQGNNISLVLDMHYFSNEYNYKLVFLYLNKYQEEEIFKYYFEEDHNIGIIEDKSNNNIIMLKSNEKNIKSILIEVSENDNQFTNNELAFYLYKIAQIINKNF